MSPTEGDDGANIQAAIDTVSAREPDADGFRGEVLLTAGTYEVAGSLRIGASGVVLRGQGDDPDGTVIRAVGRSPRALITVAGVGDRAEVAGTRQQITDTYVPVGVFCFSVVDVSGVAVGDTCSSRAHRIRRGLMPSAWMLAPAVVPLRHFGRERPHLPWGAGVTPWTPESRVMRYERRITAIENERITIDAPTVEAMQQEFGGGYLVRYQFPGRIRNVGIEYLRSDSDYASDTMSSMPSEWLSSQCAGRLATKRHVTILRAGHRRRTQRGQVRDDTG